MSNVAKKVLLIGGKSKAKLLGLSLLQQGYEVTIINKSYEDCRKMAMAPQLSVINGDGTKPYVLEEAGAEQMNIAIALTSKDEDNLVACQLCKKHFGVAKTVSLVTDPSKTTLFYKLGIDRVLCAASALTNIIQQQAFEQQLVKNLSTGMERLNICKIHIMSDAPVVGKKLAEIKLPKDIIVGCILRDAETLVPQGSTYIKTGDFLIVIVNEAKQQEAILALTGR